MSNLGFLFAVKLFDTHLYMARILLHIGATLTSVSLLPVPIATLSLLSTLCLAVPVTLLLLLKFLFGNIQHLLRGPDGLPGLGRIPRSRTRVTPLPTATSLV